MRSAHLLLASLLVPLALGCTGEIAGEDTATSGEAGGPGGAGSTITGTPGAGGQGAGSQGGAAQGGAGPSGGAGQGGAGGQPIGGEPSIVYFNYLPDGDAAVAEKIRLRVHREADGEIHLSDEVSQAGKVSYYALNGSVNRLDARQLGAWPVPPNRWLHVVKFVADIDNVNSEGWTTSAQFTGGNGTKWAQSYETTFYVADGTPAPKLGHTEPLWTSDTVSDGLVFKAAPAFTLPPGKKYGSESQPLDEPIANLHKVGWNTAPDKFRLLYAATVDGLIASVGAEWPNGVTTFDEAKLEQAADYLAASTESSVFAVDFEPGNQGDGWKWDYASPSFGSTMRRLSELVEERHGKRFYSWIGNDIRYSFQGKSLGIDGGNTGNWQAPGNGGLEETLAVHENPGAIGDVQRSSTVVQVGFGYTSIVINAVDTTSDPPSSWKSPMAWYLRALDVLNLQTLIVPDEPYLLFLWPYEDIPMDAKRTPMTRFTLPGYQGIMRQTDNRVLYPPNLIRDAIVVYLSNPHVFYTNYWLFAEHYDPLASLAYARINGQQSCAVKDTPDFHVYEYEGPDSPPCPASGSYMGKDILGVGAMVQGHEIFARHLASVLDGTQVRAALDAPFTFTRSDGATRTAEWKADTGEFARSFKFGQPWVQVWKNPVSGQRVLLFQDPFAEAFEPVSFRVTLGGQTVDRTATGNNLHYEVL